MDRVLPLLAAAVLLGACASSASNSPAAAGTPTTAFSASTTPCDTASRPGIPSDWVQVTTPQFTMCVPPSWTATASARTGQLRTGAGTMRWGVGRPVESRPRTLGVVTVTVEPGEDGRQAAIDAASRQYPSPAGNRRVERIGGRDAEVFERPSGGGTALAIAWRDPEVWVTGQSRSAAESQLQLQVVRTLRFRN